MICHDTPCKNFHSFFFLAITQAIEDNIFIFISCKNIYPLYNSESDKICTFRVMKLVVPAHCRIKYRIFLD